MLHPAGFLMSAVLSQAFNVGGKQTSQLQKSHCCGQHDLGSALQSRHASADGTWASVGRAGKWALCVYRTGHLRISSAWMHPGSLMEEISSLGLFSDAPLYSRSTNFGIRKERNPLSGAVLLGQWQSSPASRCCSYDAFEEGEIPVPLACGWQWQWHLRLHRSHHQSRGWGWKWAEKQLQWGFWRGMGGKPSPQAGKRDGVGLDCRTQWPTGAHTWHTVCSQGHREAGSATATPWHHLLQVQEARQAIPKAVPSLDPACATGSGEAQLPRPWDCGSGECRLRGGKWG